MGKLSLDDILVTPLAHISTNGGDVQHVMKNSDGGYTSFGEAYFSWVNTGTVKAWKRHTEMIMNVVVPVGMVRFVFYLDTVKLFRTVDIGRENYVRLTVPPGIWFGFQCLSESDGLVLNIASIPHDPNEVERMDLSEIDFDWS